ncbi:MAG: acyl-CoA dehydrogenase family protein [Rhodothalassiaceae bacterium]
MAQALAPAGAVTGAFNERLARFVQTQIAPGLGDWEAQGAYPLALHALAGDAGLLSLGHPADDPQAVLAAPLGLKAALLRGLTRSGAQAVPMGLGSHLVSLAVLGDGAPGLLQEVGPAVLAGRQLIALALTEPQAGSDLRNTETVVDPTTGHISGRKTFICNGSRADWLIVTAMAGPTLGLYLVNTGHGVSAKDLTPMGWRALPISDIRFDAAPARLIAEGPEAMAGLQSALALERLNLSVMALTSAELAFQAAVDWAKARHVGGAPLLKKQAVAFRLAEMKRQLRLVQVLVETLLAQSRPDPVDIAIAKNSATALVELCAREAVQLHGAHGCFAPSLVERLYRDAKLAAIGGGSEEVMTMLIARAL